MTDENISQTSLKIQTENFTAIKTLFNGNFSRGANTAIDHFLMYHSEEFCDEELTRLKYEIKRIERIKGFHITKREVFSNLDEETVLFLVEKFLPLWQKYPDSHEDHKQKLIEKLDKGFFYISNTEINNLLTKAQKIYFSLPAIIEKRKQQEDLEEKKKQQELEEKRKKQLVREQKEERKDNIRKRKEEFCEIVEERSISISKLEFHKYRDDYAESFNGTIEEYLKEKGLLERTLKSKISQLSKVKSEAATSHETKASASLVC